METQNGEVTSTGEARAKEMRFDLYTTKKLSKFANVSYQDEQGVVIEMGGAWLLLIVPIPLRKSIDLVMSTRMQTNQSSAEPPKRAVISNIIVRGELIPGSVIHCDSHRFS